MIKRGRLCVELELFEGIDRSELSLIEVAYAILQQQGEVMAFADLVNAIQKYLNKEDQEIREKLPQFYTDLNIDGSFISLGDNYWGLRAWYPIDAIDEEISSMAEDFDDEDAPPRKTQQNKINAFIDYADDEIDYNHDDPEDTVMDTEEDDDLFEENSNKEISAYNSDLSEIEVDSDLDDVDERLTIVDESEIDEDFDEEDEMV